MHDPKRWFKTIISFLFFYNKSITHLLERLEGQREKIVQKTLNTIFFIDVEQLLIFFLWHGGFYNLLFYLSIFLYHFNFNRFIRTLALTRFYIKFTTISTTYIQHIIIEFPFKLWVFLCLQVYQSNLLCTQC